MSNCFGDCKWLHADYIYWGWEFVEQIRLTRNAARCYATGEYIALAGLELFSLAGGRVLKNTIEVERRAKDE